MSCWVVRAAGILTQICLGCWSQAGCGYACQSQGSDIMEFLGLYHLLDLFLRAEWTCGPALIWRDGVSGDCKGLSTLLTNKSVCQPAAFIPIFFLLFFLISFFFPPKMPPFRCFGDGQSPEIQHPSPCSVVSESIRCCSKPQVPAQHFLPPCSFWALICDPCDRPQ